MLGLKLLRSDVMLSGVAALAMALSAAAARVRVFVRTCVQPISILPARATTKVTWTLPDSVCAGGGVNP